MSIYNKINAGFSLGTGEPVTSGIEDVIYIDAIHYTATGPVIKHHDNADALSPQEITKLVQQHRSVANAHANEVEKFLKDNRADFPLWQYNAKNKSSRQSGPRIRSIDKTSFNYPAEDSFLPLNQFLN